ncbi:hypothetical protein CSB45_08365 [candidate division KSB3 bacterium]|uniref:Uncharacterized protein n=1 Tax=candidate division KSB3 bacterium TaxID=2044937 RepID=A0A2G6E566_9BACT|nr:MAG: hypothetical protein CSB45_08365 [candidate division KSB3 bacterium]PIE29769.1 MAG: hypothetical protein CSA57_06850 [candidate division KSB3 bacterium]
MPLLFRYIVLIGLGFAIFSLWDYSGLHAYTGWRSFYAVWIPIMYAAFSSAYVLLQAWAATDRKRQGFLRVLERFKLYDEYTYLFTFAVLTVIFVGSLWKHVLFCLSVVYLAIVVLKSALFLVCLLFSVQRSRALAGEQGRVPRVLQAVLFLAAFVPYCLISAYSQQRIGLTGDEPHYLLISHSLLHDHDSNLHNNYEHRDYRHFFQDELKPTWGDRVSDTEVYSYRHKGGFPATLIPAYGLGGRFGATLQMNLITALLMLQVFLLSYESFQALTASFATWCCMAFSLPFIVYMGQIYPEVLAALPAVWCVRRIRLLEKSDTRSAAFWRQSVLIVLTSALIVLLKTRYVPLAGTLLLFWGWAFVRRHIQSTRRMQAVFGLAITIFLAVGLVLAADTLFLAGMIFDRIGDRNYMLWMLKGHNPIHGLFGILFDQEYGLLFYTPLYGLALLGMGLLTRHEWRRTAPCAVIFILNASVVAAWSLWHAAPTPPCRYLLPVLPFLGIFMTKFFDIRGGYVKALLLGVSGIWTVLTAWSLTLNPWWRYNWADGTNNFLEAQSFRLTMNLTRLFPSFSRPCSTTWPVTLLGLACVACAVYACRFEARKPRSSFRKQLSAELIAIMSLLLFIGLCSGILGLGKRLATRVIEAEDKVGVSHEGGERVPRSLDPWDNQVYLREWKYSAWALAPGDSLALHPKFAWSIPFMRQKISSREMQIFARLQYGEEENFSDGFPVLRIALNGSTLEKVPVDSTGWKSYAVSISPKTLQSTLTITHEKTQNTQQAKIVIDKIEFW